MGRRRRYFRNLCGYTKTKHLAQWQHHALSALSKIFVRVFQRRHQPWPRNRHHAARGLYGTRVPEASSGQCHEDFGSLQWRLFSWCGGFGQNFYLSTFISTTCRAQAHHLPTCANKLLAWNHVWVWCAAVPCGVSGQAREPTRRRPQQIPLCADWWSPPFS